MPDSSLQKTNVREAVPFFNVTNMPASLHFYVNGLGFRVTHEWTPDHPKVIRWRRLQHGEAGLMLQTYWRDGKPGGWPDGKLGQGFSVCFMCEDALAIRREALARGLPASRNPFVGNGMWVVSYVDPDRYCVDFESRTDVPGETEFDPAIHS